MKIIIIYSQMLQQQNFFLNFLDPAKSLELSPPNLPKAKFHVQATFATENAVMAFAVAKFTSVFPLSALSGGFVVRSTLEHSANILAELLEAKFAHKHGQWRCKVANRKKEALQMIEEAHHESKSKPTQCILFHLRILTSFVVCYQQLVSTGKQQKLAAVLPPPRPPPPRPPQPKLAIDQKKQDDDSAELLVKGVVEMLVKIQMQVLKEREHQQEEEEKEYKAAKSQNKKKDSNSSVLGGLKNLFESAKSSFSNEKNGANNNKKNASAGEETSSSSAKNDDDDAEEEEKKKPFAENLRQKFSLISPIASTVAAGFTIAYHGFKMFAEEGAGIS